MINGLTNPKVNKSTKAVWHIRSKVNKNWNDSGAFIYKGMRGVPIEVSYKIEELKLKFGEPPEDLEWGFKFSRFGFKYFYRKLIESVGQICKFLIIL